MQQLPLNGPALVMGYDWERYGRHKDEAQNEVERGWSATGVKAILAAHRRFDAPLTFFVLTKILEVPKLAALVEAVANDPLVELAQHSHSHLLFRRLLSSEQEPVSPDEYLKDIQIAQDAMIRAAGRPPIGFRAPLGYYRGLAGHPEIIRGLYGLGIRYVSSDARNQDDEFPAPWIGQDGGFRQPYLYPDCRLLEIPIQGWSDNVLKGMSRHTPLPDAGLDAEIKHHREHLQYAIKHGLLYAPAYHPWSIGAKDPTASVILWLLSECRARDIPILSYIDVYRMVQ